MIASKPSFTEPPHSGYHWPGIPGFTPKRFFEGWYFRVTLPQPGHTFAFMYSIDDPAGGTDYSGGVAQILGGPHEDYYCRTFPNAEGFWAWPHQLGLGQSRQGPAKYRQPDVFEREVLQREAAEGYQATARLHQGKLLTPGGDVQARWCYETKPVVGWGAPKAKATAGWLSYLPVFEPGWQVLMAHGLSTGWIEWANRGDRTAKPIRYSFENAPAYAEKNWGGAFPAKWAWMQCNAFASEPSLSITAVAGVREVLMFTENVGLIGIHHQGRFYEFFSTQTAFTWAVDPWGYWQMTAQSYQHKVVITGHATDAGTWVRVPTQTGLQFRCRDTTHGTLQVQLWECSALENKRLIVEATSQLAGLEVGGGPWHERWTNT